MSKARLNRQAGAFMEDLMDGLLLSAYKRALPEVKRAGVRGTLARSMTRERGKYRIRGKRGISGALNIPYDWAIYVHEGRPGFTSSTIMIWWRDPTQDPRLRRTGGVTPANKKDRVSYRDLSAKEYQDAVQAYRDHIRSGGSVDTSPVVFARSVGPTRGKFFFSNFAGMKGFGEQGQSLITGRFDQFVKQSLGDSLKVRDSATARI